MNGSSQRVWFLGKGILTLPTATVVEVDGDKEVYFVEYVLAHPKLAGSTPTLL